MLPFAGPDDVPFDPFGSEASTPDLPPGMDLEQFIDLLMQSKGPPEIEEMKRDLGPEGTRQLLRGMLAGHFDLDAMEDMLDNLPQPKARRRSRKKTPKQEPDQFDLF
jgi:hypothetical protein